MVVVVVTFLFIYLYIYLFVYLCILVVVLLGHIAVTAAGSLIAVFPGDIDWVEMGMWQ